MKKIIFYFVIIGITVTFSSCSNNEEIYNPNTCKLYKIWEKSEVGDPTEVFTYEKKSLKTIDHFDTQDSVHYLYNFTYNKDKTVSEISHETQDYTESIKIFYSDKLVCRMIYSMDNEPRMELLFKRDAETQKIVKIIESYDFTYFQQFKNVLKSNFFNYFIGFSSTAEEYFTNTKGLALHCIRELTFDENNLLTMVEKYQEYNRTVTSNFTYYEESFNPYFGLSYAYKGMLGYSKYNIKKSSVLTTVNGNETSNIVSEYEYQLNDKMYPRRIIVKRSPEFYPVNTYILYVSE